ncbi:MAG: 2Fe-2S iron-sulfur cluster-binding protein [Bryobacteraceae bacterium]
MHKPGTGFEFPDHDSPKEQDSGPEIRCLSPVWPVALETPEGERRFECGEDEFLWDAAARNGIVLPAICHQGRCLTCAGRLLSGEVDQSASATYFPEDRAAGYVLLCTGAPRGPVRIRTHEEEAMREHRLRLRLPAPYA